MDDNKQLGSDQPSTHIITDLWRADDRLGYRFYAHAVAKFVTNPLTRPLCLSLHAPPDVGRTTIMRMIQQEIDQNIFLEFKEAEVESTEGATVKDILRNLSDEDKIVIGEIDSYHNIKPCISIW